MAITDPINPKSELRKSMRALLRDHPSNPEPVRHALAQWLATRPHLQTIAVYSALPGEVDLTALLAENPERHWAYPRVSGDHLTFHLVDDPEIHLTPGAFGIREPSPMTPEIPLDRIDAFLCPGLAFDTRGGRLGRGRGFYDKLLSKARPDAEKIGVCFPSQIVADTFAEPHDIHMDHVICGPSAPV